MADRRAITVAVPVYGDLPSLLRCVDSLIEHVDVQRDAVLLVNDCGPDADEIEQALLARIEGRAGFRYERNPRNLGFVGACNRAALELDISGNDLLLLNSDTVVTAGWLDELGEVLHDSPQHGIVCARSTNATIASFPFRLRDPASPRTLERTLRTARELHDQLPRYSYPPVAMGFCFLVRRELIDEHGLFDEVFAPGYGEENDFCLRMGRLGFRSVMAHRAIVEHEGARSFQSARRARLRAEHERILVARHPDYSQRVRDYLWCEIDPVDAFADALANHEHPTRVAFFVHRSTQVADVEAAVATGAQVSVVASSRRRAKTFASLDVELLSPGAEEGRVWDLAVVDDSAPTSTRLRAAHSAPRVTSTVSSDVLSASQPSIDVAALRAQWRANAVQMRREGIPAPARPSAKSRIRAGLERRAPWVLALRQRVTSRSR